MADVPDRPPASLERARDVREDLFEVMVDVEGALASPIGADVSGWCGSVSKPLRRLKDAFDAHCEVTEGHDGLFGAILLDAPRVQAKVRRLEQDHKDIDQALIGLLSDLADPKVDPEAVRVKGTELLGLLARHRQRGADAVYDAYSVDIGGE
ncbi:MAG: hypothetical protein DYH08_10615 [Actinobacteria bacterium ATB1]|nr:hypothetical protein [Actinobacteria bacterium ATB1]